MSRQKVGVETALELARRIVGIALLALGLVVLFAQTGGHAAAPPPPVSLPISNSYLTTGNYVVGSVDLPGAGGSKITATGTINMKGVPADADGLPGEILAAWLYWETIATDPSQLAGVKFRGLDVNVVQTAQLTLTGPYASCWGSNGGGPTFTMYQMRADVRRLLPLKLDANGKSTGRRLVNDTDLMNNIDPATNQPFALHTVTLPDAGNGNNAPVSAGASLVVIYRDPRQPLRKILIYDGIGVLPKTEGATLQQPIRGIYQSRADSDARLTQIAAASQPNGTDRLFFSSSRATTLLANDPFPGTSNASDRSWTASTANIGQLQLMTPGTARQPYDGFGETVTVTVDHTKLTPYDCLSWGAIIFSTAVADIDDDGAPDGVEDRVAGLHLDADGSELPNLPAMGGSSQHKDIYFQMDGMRTTVNKTYGDPANAPYPGVAAGQLTIPPHNHLPTPAVLKLMIQTYTNAPGVSNADGTQGVRPHFDVGNTATYHGLGPDFVSTTDTAVVDSYLVPSQYAKGGSLIDETSCGLDTSPCQFQYFPGTVGWMRGFLQFSLSPHVPPF